MAGSRHARAKRLDITSSLLFQPPKQTHIPEPLTTGTAPIRTRIGVRNPFRVFRSAMRQLQRIRAERHSQVAMRLMRYLTARGKGQKSLPTRFLRSGWSRPLLAVVTTSEADALVPALQPRRDSHVRAAPCQESRPGLVIFQS